jgi:YHS domain-containing protein
VLDKKKATTHWYGKSILRDQFGAQIEDSRYTRDGKYWTSAGVTAGMDMSLAMVGEIMGEKYARTVMLDLEYDPKPPFDGGSEGNTDAGLVEGMRAMYDAGMETALHPEKAFKQLKLANKRDYICHMPTAAGIVDTAMVDGKIYGFCSKECKAEFVKNPAGYIAAEY